MFLNEDAHRLRLPNGTEIKFTDEDAYPFFYIDDVFYVGEQSRTHIDLMTSIMQESPGKYVGNASDFLGDKTEFDGRIWLKQNVIAFHEHVLDNYTLYDIIDELEDYFKIKINVNDWFIEVQNNIDLIINYMNKSSDEKKNIKPRSKTWHVKSPILKQPETPTYYKNKSIDWRFAMGENNIVKFNKYVNEACNYVDFNNKKLKYSDNDAIAFMYINSDFIIATEGGERHYDLLVKFFNRKYDLNDENNLKGRLWLNSKVISFWGFIEPIKLKSIIKDIETNSDIKINYDEWYIDYYSKPEDQITQLMTITEYINTNLDDNTSDPEYLDLKKAHFDNDKINTTGYGSKMISWDSKHNIINRQSMYQESVVNEEVDRLYVKEKDDYLHFTGENIFPFMYNGDEFILGVEGGMHSDMIADYNIDRGNMNDLGRIWVDYKTISFWSDMNLNKLLKIITDLENALLENALNIKISDDWTIEYYDYADELEIIITIDQMKKHQRGVELQLSREEYDRRLANHLNAANKDKSFGSTLTTWDSKHPIKLRQLTHQENKIIKFNDFINEKNTKK